MAPPGEGALYCGAPPLKPWKFGVGLPKFGAALFPKLVVAEPAEKLNDPGFGASVLPNEKTPALGGAATPNANAFVWDAAGALLFAPNAKFVVELLLKAEV